MLWVPGVLEEKSEVKYQDDGVQHSVSLEERNPTERKIQEFKEMMMDEECCFQVGEGGKQNAMPGPVNTKSAGSKAKSKASARSRIAGTPTSGSGVSIAVEAAKFKSHTVKEGLLGS